MTTNGFCTDPGYHDHACPGTVLERIADALETLVAWGATPPGTRPIGWTDEPCDRPCGHGGPHRVEDPAA